jgi:type VI secretion system protein ImpA
MASPATLDFERLLQPLSAEQGGGENLRADISPASIYYAIKGARDAARDKERKVPHKEEGEDEDFYFRASLPDWRRLDELARTILAERSKDLEVTAWFSEALVRLQGFAGLRDGFRLARELIEKFWDSLYPLPDEEGVLTRVAPLAGLNGEDREGTLIMPIRRVALTQGSSVPAVTFWNYQKGALPSNAATREQDQAAMNRAVAETDPGFFKDLRQDLEQCQQEFEHLCQVLDEKCGPDAPPSSSIREVLANCREALRDLSKEGTPVAEEEQVTTTAETVAAVQTGGVAKPGPVNLSNREDAFRTLLQVAGYFEHHEPHSPLSYLLKQAVRWGRMPLPELLGELIADDTARKEYCKLAGIHLDSK